MNEERIKELALKVCEEWSSFPLMRAKELIRTVAVEVQKEEEQKAQERVDSLMALAERLKEQEP